jgi:hypothetical protein
MPTRTRDRAPSLLDLTRRRCGRAPRHLRQLQFPCLMETRCIFFGCFDSDCVSQKRDLSKPLSTRQSRSTESWTIAISLTESEAIMKLHEITERGCPKGGVCPAQN